jgi:cell division protein ZapA (FtsZ GTPase activity inhibitor)
LIGVLILWKRGERDPRKNIMIQGTIMTTDELFKAHNQTKDKEIPEPFISSDNIESEIAEEKYHTIPELKNNKAELSEEESENKWKKWDEG